MPLSPADDQILATCYRNLKEEPIEPGHRFYVEIWEHNDYDPVQRLRKHIVWSEIESLQLFSGFSGSGKSTSSCACGRTSRPKATLSSTQVPKTT